MTTPTVGQQAPALTATAHTGEVLRLEDFKGSRVLLWFYPKADTPGCTAQGCGLRDRVSEVTAHHITILGASFDTPEENRAFAEKHGFPYKLLSVSPADGMAWGVAESPSQSNAKRVGFLIAPDGRIERVWDPANARTFVADVLASLAS
jgi:peroxiredoxin Q/BCP